MPESQPLYTPKGGIGSLSPQGEWKFMGGTNWVKNIAAPPVPRDVPPTNVTTETPSGTLPPIGDAGTTNVSALSNLRLALRMAAEEAGKERVAGRLEQFQGAGLGRTPGTLGSIADIIRASVKPPVESIFGDVMKGITEANEAKRKELERINELRLEYGSAIPSNVTDLQTAIKLVTPLVDQERKLKLDKLATDQQTDDDVETWAEYIADGGAVGNVPAKIRTAARSRADKLLEERESQAQQEYKDRINFKIERKVSDFDAERESVLLDDDLTVLEQREMLDYIDQIEESAKLQKQQQKKIRTPIPSTGTSAQPRNYISDYSQGGLSGAADVLGKLFRK